MSNFSPPRRVTKREPKFPDQGRRMSNYKLKRTNTLSSSIESGFYAVDNDITQLKEVTERSLLSTLKSRFASDFIYTYAGPILISINPYNYLPIYNPKYLKFYQGAKLHELPPHVFAIADAAYQSMLNEGRNQCVVIGGESGSGKTETTKFLLNHLTSLSAMLLPQDILNHIIYAGPILEAFGNATTLDNHNSSRFGKYISLCFKENGTYRGAYIEKYLLEQCRIVSQVDGERNFHVFYYLLSGASEQMKEELFLSNNTHYAYLSNNSCVNPSKHDIESYMRLCNLLTSLKFEDHIQFNIFSILSAILHLGNLAFNESEPSLDSNTLRELTLVSQLLKVPLELLTQTLTHRQKSVGSEKIVTPCTRDQKVYTRDALAKALYSSLFDWILFRINDILNGRVAKREFQLKTIGLLDIFGFENVRRNSFEQFCINYANEQLHHYFINFVLKLEQEEYVKDKIEWRQIAYKDNEECINLFAKRSKGLFILINDESSIPGGSDLTLYEKFILNHRNNSYFKFPQLKQQSPTFTVSHFAGAVTYHISQFIEKNKDLMCKSVVDLLRTSEDRLIRELIGVEPIGNIKWRKLGLVFKAATLFKSTLTTKNTPPPLPPKSVAHKTPPPTFLSFPRNDTEGHVAGSKSALAFRQMNSREGETGNCIRFIQSYNPSESPRKRFSNKKRSKNRSLERKNGKYKQIDSRPRFNSFDVQELRGAPTVVSQYQSSLLKLMEQLSAANPFFIKCIRSNTNQTPKHFSDEAVRHQLSYSGLFEAIKVRQAGYSIRMPFQDFLNKYQPLIGLISKDADASAVLVSDFLRQQYLPYNSYQIGATKVFIHEMEGQRLDERLNTVLLQRVVFLQKSVRLWLGKRRFTRFRNSLTEVQAAIRGYLVRSVVQKKLSAVISIQSVWRGFFVRKAIAMVREGKTEYRNILRNNPARKSLQYGDIIITKAGNSISYPPGKEKLKNKRSLFEPDFSPQYSPLMRGSATLSVSNSNPFRLSYIEAVQKQHSTRFESRDNDSSKYDLSRVKRMYEEKVMSPLRMKVRSDSMDGAVLRPGSVNDIIKDLVDVNSGPRCRSAQRRTSKTISRCNFSEPTETDFIFAPGIAKSPVSYSKSYDFGDSSFAPIPPPHIAPKEIFSKLLKTHSSYLNNMPLDRETIFKQSSSLHFTQSARFNTEMFQEKLTTPLPTNYNHVRVKRNRAKPVVRREAIRVTSPSVERPHILPSSPLTSGYNFFPKIIQEDDSSDGCVSTTHQTRKKRELERVRIKSLSCVSPFEMIFQGKSSSQPALHKGSLSLTRSAGTDYNYVDVDLRPRAVTVSTLNSGSRSLSRSLQITRDKMVSSPIHTSATIQSKLYSFASPFKRDRPRKEKHERAKGKVELTNYAHGHEPKPYIAFQRTSCSKCHRTLHPPFHKRCVYKCSLCNLVFHEICMQFANTCKASSGDVVIARNLSDLSKLISFLLDKKDVLSERPRQKDTMDDFYILALERMHASMLTNTSLRAQMFSEEATQIKTQAITIGNVLHDFSLILSPLVSDTKSQLVLRNVFMNLLEDFLLKKTSEDADPNSTIAPQAIKVLQRRKEIQKPKLICGHTFLEKHFNVLTVCEFCNVPMSLVEPGQFCNTCDYVAHKACLASIKTQCVINCESNDFDSQKTEKVTHFARPLNSIPKSPTGLPQIFELCLKSIESTGLVAEGLYRKASAKNKVVRLRAGIIEDIDTVDWELVEVHTVCSIVKNFLSELPDPLLTFDLYDKCILAAKMTERAEKLRAIQAIVHLLPPIHYNCLERLIFHMAQVAKGEEHNKMSPQSLAIIFAPVLLRPPDEMPLIELAKMVPFQSAFLQAIIEEQLKKFRDTMQDLEQLDRDRRDTIRKMKQLAQDDNKSDSGIFDQPTQDDVTQTVHWKQLNAQLTEIESQKFSLTFELARLDLGESSNEDSSSHDSIEATI